MYMGETGFTMEPVILVVDAGDMEQMNEESVRMPSSAVVAVGVGSLFCFVS